jgi:hypothetical protein
MPSFAHYFMQRPDRSAALLVFLSSLRGTPRAAPKAGTEATCQSCHADVKKPTGAPHRCAFLHEEKLELSCARCHAGGLPPGQGPCAYVERRAHECLVCHEASGARKEGKDGS